MASKQNKKKRIVNKVKGLDVWNLLVENQENVTHEIIPFLYNDFKKGKRRW